MTLTNIQASKDRVIKELQQDIENLKKLYKNEQIKNKMDNDKL